MRRNAIIHIGTEKTGTTSIQASLQALRENLPARGYAFPRSPGDPNHTLLARYALAAQRERTLRKASQGGVAAEERLPALLAEELENVAPSVHTVIFSNEHCHSRLGTEEEVAKLKGLLDRHFHAYRIVVYLRRQDELAVSRYSTRLRNGAVGAQIIPRSRRNLAYYDHAALLQRWGAVFGRDVLLPRLFIRSELRDGNVVKDLLSVCKLEDLDVPMLTAQKNSAMSALGQEFIRQFNAARPRGVSLGRPARLLRLVSRAAPGTTQLPSRSQAEAFYGRFRKGNDLVRREFFPDRAALFPEDFSQYPDTTAAVPRDAVLDLAHRLLAEMEALAQAGPKKNSDFKVERSVIGRMVTQLCPA